MRTIPTMVPRFYYWMKIVILPTALVVSLLVRNSLRDSPRQAETTTEQTSRRAFAAAQKGVFEFRDGEGGSARTVSQELEQRVLRNPDDAILRARLLGYYMLIDFRSQGAIHDARRRHIIWFILHHPDWEFSASPYLAVNSWRDKSQIRETRRLWLQEIATHPGNASILGNAGQSLLDWRSNRDIAENLLRRAAILEPRNRRWHEQLGRLYSLRLVRLTGCPRREMAGRALAEYREWFRLTHLTTHDSDTLSSAAMMAAEAGADSEAQQYATDLLRLAAHQKPDDSSDAVHHGNIVLGRVALHRGQLAAARAFLLAAAKVPDSGTLDSFGPNMSLARELLEKGDRMTVLQYFQLCKRFWDGDRLDRWSSQVRRGQIPDFRANLDY